jgi:hypothetical protein
VPTPAPSQAALAARDHLAQSQGIPVESLVIVNEQRTQYPNLGRTFQAVKLLDIRPKGRFYGLLVDLNDGTVIEDVDSIEAAEERARVEKYGKLQPALYDRLQTMKDDETVTVMIWAAAGPGQSLPEREKAAIATLAAKYPEARAAVERSGKPMDVDDRALAWRIETEYRELLDAGMAQRVEPLVKALEAQGITVRTSKGLPAVTVSLTKKALLLLAQRDEVGAIGLAEGGQFVRSSSAASPSQAHVTWEQVFKGSGGLVVIAVLGGLALPLTYLSWRTDRLAKRRLPWVILVTAMALTLPLFYLNGCRPPEQPLPFETVAQRDIINYREEKPALFVIAKAEEIDDFTQNVLAEDPALANQLRALDYNRFFAVLALHGYIGSSGYNITVHKVVQQDSRVIVQAEFVEPAQGMAILDTFTSPYHLISVSKKGSASGKQIQFVLVKGDQPVAETTHFIP